MAKTAALPLSKITAKIAALQLKSEKLTAEIKALSAVVTVESKKIAASAKASEKKAPAKKAPAKKPAAAKKAAAPKTVAKW